MRKPMDEHYLSCLQRKLNDIYPFNATYPNHLVLRDRLHS